MTLVRQQKPQEIKRLAGRGRGRHRLISGLEFYQQIFAISPRSVQQQSQRDAAQLIEEAFAALTSYGSRADGLKSIARYIVERKN